MRMAAGATYGTCCSTNLSYRSIGNLTTCCPAGTNRISGYGGDACCSPTATYTTGLEKPWDNPVYSKTTIPASCCPTGQIAVKHAKAEAEGCCSPGYAYVPARPMYAGSMISTSCCPDNTTDAVVAEGALFGACCEKNAEGYMYGIHDGIFSTGCCQLGYSGAYIPGTIEGACCPPGYPAVKTTGNKTSCCSNYVIASGAKEGACCGGMWDNSEAIRTGLYQAKTSCCLPGSVARHPVGTIDGACCAPASAYYTNGQKTFCSANAGVGCPAGMSSYENGTCCSNTSAYVKATGATYGACCPAGAETYRNGDHTVCCTGGEKGVIAAGASYGSCCAAGVEYYQSYSRQTVCCPAGLKASVAPGATYGSCCSSGMYYKTAQSFSPLVFTTACCNANETPAQAAGADTGTCIPENATPFPDIGTYNVYDTSLHSTITITNYCLSGTVPVKATGAIQYTCCSPGVEYMKINNGTLCCQAGQIAVQPDNVSRGVCCIPGQFFIVDGKFTLCKK